MAGEAQLRLCVVVVDAYADNTWDSFVVAVPGGHHVQTSLWARVKPRLGWRAARVTLRRQGRQPVAGCQLLIRSLPLIGNVGYVTKGPLCPEEEPVSALLLALSGDTVLAKVLGWSAEHGDCRPSEGVFWGGHPVVGSPRLPVLRLRGNRSSGRTGGPGRQVASRSTARITDLLQTGLRRTGRAVSAPLQHPAQPPTAPCLQSGILQHGKATSTLVATAGYHAEASC